MKNVSLTVGPYSVYMPPAPPVPQSQFQPPAPTTSKPSHQVTFSALFDTETEALNFSAYLLTLEAVDIKKEVD